MVFIRGNLGAFPEAFFQMIIHAMLFIVSRETRLIQSRDFSTGWRVAAERDGRHQHAPGHRDERDRQVCERIVGGDA